MLPKPGLPALLSHKQAIEESANPLSASAPGEAGFDWAHNAQSKREPKGERIRRSP